MTPDAIPPSLPFDLGFTEEHAMLRRNAAQFLSQRCPFTEVRRLADDPVGVSPELSREVSALGWLGAALPEAHGGLGLGVLHLALVLEQAGRFLLPSPLLGTILAGLAIDRGGNDAQQGALLPAIASGERVATMALAEPDGGFDPEDPLATAEPVDGGFRLTGTKVGVPFGSSASLLVASFRTPDGVAPFVVELPAEGVSVEPEITVDPTRRTARITFQGARVPREARLAPRGLRFATRVGLVLLAAEMMGGADALLTRTAAYAAERRQFDRAIGAFQAVKHPLVDVLIAVELGRSLVFEAAAALDHDAEGGETLARMAKAHASEAFPAAAQKAVQLHGGFGFTWDCDVHFYLRRALATRPLLGDAAWQRARLAERLFG